MGFSSFFELEFSRVWVLRVKTCRVVGFQIVWSGTGKWKLKIVDDSRILQGKLQVSNCIFNNDTIILQIKHQNIYIPFPWSAKVCTFSYWYDTLQQGAPIERAGYWPPSATCRPTVWLPQNGLPQLPKWATALPDRHWTFGRCAKVRIFVSHQTAFGGANPRLNVNVRVH